MTDATAAGGFTARAWYADGKVAYTSHGHPSAAVAYAYAMGNAFAHGGTAAALDENFQPTPVTVDGLLREIPAGFHDDRTLTGLANLAAGKSGPMRPGETFAAHGERLAEAVVVRQGMWRAFVGHPAYRETEVEVSEVNDAAWRVVHLLVAVAVLRRAEAATADDERGAA